VMAVTDIGNRRMDIDLASTGEQVRGEKVGILKSVSRKAWKWILIAAAVFAATRLYYVQEMMAALVLFAVLFSCIAAVLFLFFVLDRAGLAMLGFLELRAREMLQHARGWRGLSDPR